MRKEKPPQKPSDEPKREKSDGRLGYLHTDVEIKTKFTDRIRSSHGLPHESNPSPDVSAASLLKKQLNKNKNPKLQ